MKKKRNKINWKKNLFCSGERPLLLGKLHNLLVNLEPLPPLDGVHVTAGGVLGVCLLPKVKELLLVIDSARLLPDIEPDKDRENLIM